MIKRFIIAIVLLVLVCGGIVGFNLFRANAIKQYFATMKQPAATVSTVTVEPQTWQPGHRCGRHGQRAPGRRRRRRDQRHGQDDQFQGEPARQGRRPARPARRRGGARRSRLGEVRAEAHGREPEARAAARRARRQRDLQPGERAVERDRRRSRRSRSSKAVLDQKQLRAPFSGTIGIPKVDVGQYLTAGTAVATLQSLETMRVDFTVPEQEFSEPQARPDRQGRLQRTTSSPMPGQIIGINPKIDPSSRLVSVRGEIDNLERRPAAGPVRAGARRTAGGAQRHRVAADGRDDQPLRRLRLRRAACPGEARARTSRRAPPARARRRARPAARRRRRAPATISSCARSSSSSAGTTGERVEVTKGVKAGDVVVTAGQNRLSNGMPVKIDNSVNPAESRATRRPDCERFPALHQAAGPFDGRRRCCSCCSASRASSTWPSGSIRRSRRRRSPSRPPIRAPAPT